MAPWRMRSGSTVLSPCSPHPTPSLPPTHLLLLGSACSSPSLRPTILNRASNFHPPKHQPSLLLCLISLPSAHPRLLNSLLIHSKSRGSPLCCCFFPIHQTSSTPSFASHRTAPTPVSTPPHHHHHTTTTNYQHHASAISRSLALRPREPALTPTAEISSSPPLDRPQPPRPLLP